MEQGGNHQKVYRFGMYGRAASGKTCILAALAMRRRANPENISCTWLPLPPGIKPPSADRTRWDPNDRATGFYLGKEWLENAICCLSKGDLPPPNPNRHEPLRFLYDFTTPEPRTYRVELIDYSGELIDPSLTNDDLAVRLRDHLCSMDGLLVLAEAPCSEADVGPLGAELSRLEQAFSVLKGEKLNGSAMDTPVALLLNKWDRRGSGDTVPGDLKTEATQFLDACPHTAHATLATVLRNSVAKKANFQPFAASAFGTRHIGSSPEGLPIERPRQVNPLPSFGLEAPFVWLALQCDNNEIDRCESHATTLSPWRFWQMWRGRPTSSRRQAQQIAERLAPTSPVWRRADKIVSRCSRISWIQCLCNVILVIGLALAIEGSFDSVRVKTIRNDVAEPQSSGQTLEEGQTWLADYLQAPWYRHLFAKRRVLTVEQAEALRADMSGKQDEIAWEPVAKAKDLQTQASLAKDYLKQLPNGSHQAQAKTVLQEAEVERDNTAWQPIAQEKDVQFRANRSQNYLDTRPEGKHRDEASTFIAVAATDRQRQANDRHLAGVRFALSTTQKVDDLQKLRASANQTPHPTAISDEYLRQQRELDEEMRKRSEALSTINLENEYYGLMRGGKVIEAAKALAIWPNQGAPAVVQTHFRQQVVPLLQAEASKNMGTQNWSKARTAITDAMNDLHVTQRLYKEQLLQLQQILDQVNEAQDRDLYRQVGTYKDKGHVEAYIANAPLQRMKKTVKSYQAYVTKMANPVDLVLRLERIEWGDTWNNEDNRIAITLDGEKAIERIVRAYKWKSSDQIGMYSFKKNVNESVKLHIRAISLASWTSLGDGDSGQADWEGTPAALNGKIITLPGADHTNKAVFRVLGIPEEPVLPLWGGE